MLFLLFFVPLLVMASAYCGVCVELWAVTESSTPSPRCGSDQEKLFYRFINLGIGQIDTAESRIIQMCGFH